MVSIAKSSEKGRDFEVAGQLIKTQSEVAKDLLDIHKQIKDIEDDKTTIKTQNNILFTGSTSELIKQIEEKRKETFWRRSWINRRWTRIFRYDQNKKTFVRTAKQRQKEQSNEKNAFNCKRFH